MSDPITVYGTDAAVPERETLSIGPLSLTVENGALRHIKLHGIEAIRSIAFLVRDRDWGTLEPDIRDRTLDQSDGALRFGYHARYVSQGAQLDVKITVTATSEGLSMRARGQASGAFETNRAGFTVLHPINGLAGHPVTVAHSDGSVEEAVFPERIAPWQPFMDITGLSHQAGDMHVACRFEGDTFEMEDQRQWGDASYKTYNRPLALPWPYEIADGAGLEQSVELRWSARPRAVPVHGPILGPVPARDAAAQTRARFPATALVITPRDAVRLAGSPEDLLVIRPHRLLCHLDASLGGTCNQFYAFRAAQTACPDVRYDLELIGAFDGDPAVELDELARQMRLSGFEPETVMVCPSVDRQSTPPGSQWPACPPLEQIHQAAAAAFPGLKRGGGMVSLFTELNRKRPPVHMLDFVSHGLCPIVHAADDLSVMETLEAIPHITASARQIIAERPYRIGPCTIAMRQNPYGSRTIPNPDLDRLCMADDDPRHRAQFGLAYVIGLATALAQADIEVWTPAALYGPRGVTGGADVYPMTTALRALVRLAGQDVHKAEILEGIAHLHVGGVQITANLTAHPNGALPPFDWTLTQRS